MCSHSHSPLLPSPVLHDTCIFSSPPTSPSALTLVFQPHCRFSSSCFMQPRSTVAPHNPCCAAPCALSFSPHTGNPFSHAIQVSPPLLPPHSLMLALLLRTPYLLHLPPPCMLPPPAPLPSTYAPPFPRPLRGPHGGDAVCGGRPGPHTYVFTLPAPSTITPFRPAPLPFLRPLRRPHGGDAVSGGHTAEMLCLVGALDHGRYSPRCYIAAATDAISLPKARQLEQALAQKATTSPLAPASAAPPPSYLSGYCSREVEHLYVTSMLILRFPHSCSHIPCIAGSACSRLACPAPLVPIGVSESRGGAVIPHLSAHHHRRHAARHAACGACQTPTGASIHAAFLLSLVLLWLRFCYSLISRGPATQWHAIPWHSIHHSIPALFSHHSSSFLPIRARPCPSVSLHAYAAALQRAGHLPANLHRRFHTACAWEVHGRCMGGAWEVHGRCMGGAWEVHGRCMGGAWEVHGTTSTLVPPPFLHPQPPSSSPYIGCPLLFPTSHTFPDSNLTPVSFPLRSLHSQSQNTGKQSKGVRLMRLIRTQFRNPLPSWWQVLGVQSSSIVFVESVARVAVLGVQSSSIVFVESVARVDHLSLTGRLLHRLGIVDRFFVQWPHLTSSCKGTHYLLPRAPLPCALLPRAPLPRAPLPHALLLRASLPRALLPRALLPCAPRCPAHRCPASCCPAPAALRAAAPRPAAPCAAAPRAAAPCVAAPRPAAPRAAAPRAPLPCAAAARALLPPVRRTAAAAALAPLPPARRPNPTLALTKVYTT
ncbi:unnamed protein product [Closterium sp. Naga37s-1]|nr:unnamed protein product [Closterium sp. Naga37s-1]